MPRDQFGVYTLPPVINPVVTNTVIRSTWANPTMDDIAAALTDSVSRSGDGGLTAPLLLVDGTPALPGLAFVNDPSTGVLLNGLGVLELAAGGQSWFRIDGNTGEILIWNGSAWVPIAESGFTGQRGFSWYKREVITQVGDNLWTKADHPNTTLFKISLTAGGGGGASSNGSSSNFVEGGSGGGGGGTAILLVPEADMDASYTATVGAGGAGGQAPNTQPGEGGSSGGETRWGGLSGTRITGGNGGAMIPLVSSNTDFNTARGGTGGVASIIADFLGGPLDNVEIIDGEQGGDSMLYSNGVIGRSGGGGGGGGSNWGGGTPGSNLGTGGSEGIDGTPDDVEYGPWGYGGSGAHSGYTASGGRVGGNGGQGVIIIDHFVGVVPAVAVPVILPGDSYGWYFEQTYGEAWDGVTPITWDPADYPDTTAIDVILTGGGGGGGGANRTANFQAAGAGGSGAQTIFFNRTVGAGSDIPAPIQITVARGGAGGVGGNTGSDGEASFFDSDVIAGGGVAGASLAVPATEILTGALGGDAAGSTVLASANSEVVQGGQGESALIWVSSTGAGGVVGGAGGSSHWTGPRYSYGPVAFGSVGIGGPDPAAAAQDFPIGPWGGGGGGAFAPATSANPSYDGGNGWPGSCVIRHYKTIPVA